MWQSFSSNNRKYETETLQLFANFKDLWVIIKRSWLKNWALLIQILWWENMSSLPSHCGCFPPLVVCVPPNAYVFPTGGHTLFFLVFVLTYYPLLPLPTFTALPAPSSLRPFRTNSMVPLFLFWSVISLDSELPDHSLKCSPWWLLMWPYIWNSSTMSSGTHMHSVTSKILLFHTIVSEQSLSLLEINFC